MTDETDNPNISTEHQPKGSGLNPSDTLDKGNATAPPGVKTDVAEDIGPEIAPEPGFATNGE